MFVNYPKITQRKNVLYAPRSRMIRHGSRQSVRTLLFLVPIGSRTFAFIRQFSSGGSSSRSFLVNPRRTNSYE